MVNIKGIIKSGNFLPEVDFLTKKPMITPTHESKKSLLMKKIPKF